MTQNAVGAPVTGCSDLSLFMNSGFVSVVCYGNMVANNVPSSAT